MGSLTASVFDTNILIDYLNGYDEASVEVASCDRRIVSFITVIEVLAGCATAGEETAARSLLAAFEMVRVPDPLIELTVKIRQNRRLKLPDAIVLATARFLDCQLITRNTKDFAADDPNIRVPYVL